MKLLDDIYSGFSTLFFKGRNFEFMGRKIEGSDEAAYCFSSTDDYDKLLFGIAHIDFVDPEVI